MSSDATELTDLQRVGPSIAESLREAGYETVDEVLDADPDTLADEVDGIGETSARIIQGDEEDTSGRPDKLEQYRDSILDAAERGLTYEGIARVAGIGKSTLYEWFERYPEFSDEVKRARARAERELIRDCSPEFVLQTSYGYTKTEEKQVSMDADVSVDAEENVTADFVTYDSEDETDE
ncbi:hypothetical protein Z052_01970 [Halorubrum sp. C191]|uniref:helix-hairpin-helix domain-containing protein n=1 Tax=Halorubrum sp. C191 TaxID=1383842 RepID=UPI000C0818A3|nr:helix-hairpin-helix domain-containing protein [Halorubrum sp. C191]PHQ43930.1 hypothetical protein Z052_01970 [Halorubrum sp. C191]